MRGMFTAGILDVFMEEGIHFDGAIGVSAGAAFGLNYKTGQISRAIRYNMRYSRDKRYCGLWSLLSDGNLYSRRFCYGDVPLKFDKFNFAAYERNSMPFYVVATDIETGQPVYHEYGGQSDHLFEWVRASASMPLVSQPVEIDGRKLLDGGISDSIPLRHFESLGYRRNVIILTQPDEYEKKENGLLRAVRLMYRKYPHLVKAMEERHLHYNDTLQYIRERERSGEVLVLRPGMPLPVSRVEKDPEKLRQAYEIGRSTAYWNLAGVRAFLAGGEPPVVGRDLRNIYVRRTKTPRPADEQAEYWLEFADCCVHLPFSGHAEYARQVPPDAQPLAPVTDDPLNAAALHRSFIGATLSGIYSDDGDIYLCFDNGNVIHFQLTFAATSDDPHYWDYTLYTAELLQSGKEHLTASELKDIRNLHNLVSVRPLTTELPPADELPACFSEQSAAEVYELAFVGSGLAPSYVEDLPCMGLPALMFYFKLLHRYIREDHANGDYKLVNSLICHLHGRLHQLQQLPQQFRREVADCVRYIIDNKHLFRLADYSGELVFMEKAHRCLMPDGAPLQELTPAESTSTI